MKHGILFIFLVALAAMLHILPSYGQVADNTVGGIIVPKFTSTQSQYCSNGQCGTGSVQQTPSNYTRGVDHIPVLLITLSNTCEVLNKHGMTGCPSVEELMKNDTSNKMISGKFIKQNGIYTREKPQMKNNWLAYVYAKNKVICVECYFDVTATDKAQQIIIQPNSFTYVNKTESESKNIFYNFYGRYMQGCDTATIANIPGLLNDTISFMLHGCITQYTTFHNTQNHTRTLHPFVLNSPYSSLVLSYNLSKIFHGHTVLHNEKMPTMGGLGPSNCQTGQCTLTTSTKKW